MAFAGIHICTSFIAVDIQNEHPFKEISKVILVIKYLMETRIENHLTITNVTYHSFCQSLTFCHNCFRPFFLRK